MEANKEIIVIDFNELEEWDRVHNGARPKESDNQRSGFYSWAEPGFAVLDNRKVILGNF